MNYLSNYWTHRTSNEKNRSQVAGTQPGLVPENLTWAQVKAMSTRRRLHGIRLQRVVHPSRAFLSLSLSILRDFHSKWKRCGATSHQILRVWRIIKKGRWWQREFLYISIMGNSCKIMNEIKNNLQLHQNLI